ncbi:MAG TPA: dihydropteroate synthase [Gemmatimonadaceae bacterium]|nr:dihydropteroate synthase [Gemmatimonadaceae bacterium]
MHAPLVTGHSSPVTGWSVRARRIPLDRPRIAGILNVTPDSFSDGGRYASVEDAARAAEGMLAEGADLIDVGGESTRPGARRITSDEELARVLPVVRVLRQRVPEAVLSVDTTRAEVARAVLDAGAHAINDVSGLRLDPAVADVVASHGAGLILMHSRGSVEEMAGYALAAYGADVVAEILRELEPSVERALQAGVAREAIVLDPGIGFAKRSEHSLAALRGLDRLAAAGFPVMIGASRKRVVGEITGESAPDQRAAGSVGAHVIALARGARLFRVHDVRVHRHALDVAARILLG